jgi:hypothetical protein
MAAGTPPRGPRGRRRTPDPATAAETRVDGIDPPLGGLVVAVVSIGIAAMDGRWLCGPPQPIRQSFRLP